MPDSGPCAVRTCLAFIRWGSPDGQFSRLRNTSAYQHAGRSSVHARRKALYRPAIGRIEPKDLLLYLGCNVLRTAHLAKTVIAVLRAMGLETQHGRGPGSLLRNRALPTRRSKRGPERRREQHATLREVRCETGLDVVSFLQRALRRGGRQSAGGSFPVRACDIVHRATSGPHPVRQSHREARGCARSHRLPAIQLRLAECTDDFGRDPGHRADRRPALT